MAARKKTVRKKTKTRKSVVDSIERELKDLSSDRSSGRS
jgi:hypothetical protein